MKPPPEWLVEWVGALWMWASILFLPVSILTLIVAVVCAARKEKASAAIAKAEEVSP